MPSGANGGSKKYYAVTPQGREVLGELIGFWRSYSDCVDGFIRNYERTEVPERKNSTCDRRNGS